MTNDQRRRFSNLMVLCDPHHDIVDQQWEQYTVETLHRWKEQREAAPDEALKRLREVTPTGLRKIVADGLKDHDEKLLRVLDRLSEQDIETASLVRGLIDELTEAYTWQSRNLPDPDVLGSFGQAVYRLRDMMDGMDSFARAVRRYERIRPEE
jgi:hypothetical protein